MYNLKKGIKLLLTFFPISATAIAVACNPSTLLNAPLKKSPKITTVHRCLPPTPTPTTPQTHPSNPLNFLNQIHIQSI